MNHIHDHLNRTSEIPSLVLHLPYVVCGVGMCPARICCSYPPSATLRHQTYFAYMFGILFMRSSSSMDPPVPKARPPPPRPKSSAPPPRPVTTAASAKPKAAESAGKEPVKPELLTAVVKPSESLSTGFGEWEEVVQEPNRVVPPANAPDESFHPISSETLFLDSVDLRDDSARKRVYTTVKAESEDVAVFAKGRKKPAIRKRSDD